MRAAYIYFLKDPEDSMKGYVGKTVNPEARLVRHRHDAKKQTYRRATWIKSLLEKGLKPEFEFVAQVPESDWQQWEIDYIAAFRSMGFDLVNTTDGGDAGPDCTGKKHTPETRAKISAAQAGEKGNMFGKHHAPETRAKMSATHKALGLVGEKHPGFGKVPSAEARAKMSVAHAGEKNHFFGKKHTPESLAKRLATLKLNAALRSKKKD